MEHNKKRLFFAVWPDEATRRRIGAASADLLHWGAGRPVAQQNLHMTLAFLGSVDSGRLPDLLTAAVGCHTDRFTLTLDTLGFWRRSRILWFGCSKTPEPLVLLVDQLREILAGHGFEPERRVFHPHVSLARRATPPKRAAKSVSIGWPVEDFCLVESLPGGRRSRYEVLATWPLAASAGRKAMPAGSKADTSLGKL